MAQILWRATIITHRYLGVAVGLLMLVWFLSGIVMMYVPYPGLTASDRIRVSPPIPWQTCCTFDSAPNPDDAPIEAVQLRGLAGQPVLLVRQEDQGERLSSLAPESPSLVIDEKLARDVASATAEKIIGPGAEPFADDVIERDQWTVGEAGAGNRPLFRYRFADPARTTLYVSGTTGEMVLWTTGSQRFWNWLGAVPHWLYFTELRANVPLWSQIIIWSSLVGGFLTILGLYLGIAQFKRGASGRLSPYRGWFYWHHIVGLVFGVVTLTWVLSGTLSMTPWGLLVSEPGNERARLVGEPLSWRSIRESLAAIQTNPPDGDIVRLTSAPLDGKLFWLATTAQGAITRLDESGRPTPLAIGDLAAASKRLAGTNALASAELIESEDAYYFNFQGYPVSDPLLFPVYRIIANDAEKTRYYLDPRSGQLIGTLDTNGRANRWLFNGLHRFDFSAWLRVRPLWDIVVLLLMSGGVAATGTGVYLAFGRIKRDLGIKQRSARPG